MGFQPSFLGGLLPATVRVTAADIRRGATRNCLRCPVANALRRHFQATLVSVSPTAGAYISLSRPANGFWGFSVDLPDAVVARIKHYDCNGELAPFEFTLEHPRGGYLEADVKERNRKEVARV